MRFVRAGIVPYADAWATQRLLHAERVADRIGDVCLLLEHPPVYTAGKRTEIWERPLRTEIPVVDVDRGGKITWHGPGQLVGYPIVKLPEPYDVVAHVRRIEQALIDVCAAHGVTDAGRVDGRSGVWVGDAKVAAIGIRVSQGVTMHGFALNCDCDLTAFDDIVPCGITDAAVTSLTVLTGKTVTTQDVVDDVEAALSDALEPVRG